MRTNYDNLLYPEEAISSYKEKLIDIYIDDYGEEYADLIRDRVNNIFYYFDSNPIDTYVYLYNHAKNDLALSKRMSDEAEDYIKCRDKEFERVKKEYIRVLEKVFCTEKEIPELFDLDLSFLIDNSISDFDYYELDEQYKDDCRYLGVKPIYDTFLIFYLLALKEKMYKHVDLYLLENSLWGKRIVDRFKDNFEMSISQILDATTLPKKTLGRTARIVGSDGKELRTVITLPLVSLSSMCNVDYTFLHEMRHAVEFVNTACGLSSQKGNYTLINEIHTDDNAIKDLRKIEGVIWGQELSVWSVYQKAFPYVLDFFDGYKELINNISINNDIELFEKIFGIGDLSELDLFISKLMNNKNNLGEFPYNYSKRLLKKLDDNADRYFRNK